MRGLLPVLLLIITTSPACGQADPNSRTQNQPVEPFQIFANLYYVGASDVTSFLITTPAGHILLDGGFAETAPQILANIRKLGFNARDVKVLLNSHAHFDHAGGLAELKRATGALLWASREDALLLERGGRNDFAFDDRLSYEPVAVDRMVDEGTVVRLGGSAMVAQLTPGHTKGCTTWTLSLAAAGESHSAVFVCSASVPGYRLVNNPRYPNIVEHYRGTFAKLRNTRADIFLAPHGNFFALTAKRKKMPAAGADNPFVDAGGLQEYVESAHQAFEAELQRQLTASSAQASH
jgi:metallo-beta-lactamase class B